MRVSNVQHHVLIIPSRTSRGRKLYIKHRLLQIGMTAVAFTPWMIKCMKFTHLTQACFKHISLLIFNYSGTFVNRMIFTTDCVLVFISKSLYEISDCQVDTSKWGRAHEFVIMIAKHCLAPEVAFCIIISAFVWTSPTFDFISFVLLCRFSSADDYHNNLPT